MQKIIFLFLIAIIFTQNSYSLVDMSSGSYSNTWTDIEVPGTGYDMAVTRAYKSRTIYNGMFGFGWCSAFETRIFTTAEGNIKVSECGDGQEVLYSKKTIEKKDTSQAITQIIEKMKADAKSTKLSADYYKKLEEQLFEDVVRRDTLAKQYGSAVMPEEGVKYTSAARGIENVVYQKTHYLRTLADGSSQKFNLDGQLVQMFDKNQNYLKFEYNNNKHLVSVEDNNTRKLSFNYYPTGKVKFVSGPNGILSEYKYSKEGDLVWNKNAWAKADSDVYTYEYNKYHNLTKITWPNKKTATLKYDDKKDWVLSFTDLDKCVETYKYEVSKNNPKTEYSSSVTKTCKNKVVTTSTHSFWHALLPTGEPILTRMLNRKNGVETDITYHPVFAKAISIKNATQTNRFEYYADGMIKTKFTSQARFDYTHDSATKKISSVTKTILDKNGKVVSTTTSNYKYNSKGNLIAAENSDGKNVQLVYDYKGRIETVTDVSNKILKIEYEERFGKPSLVSRPGLGSMKVTYKKNGEVSKIESKEGPSVAAQVSIAFDELIQVISPATENIYL